eukprot:gene16003-19041_t
MKNNDPNKEFVDKVEAQPAIYECDAEFKKRVFTVALKESAIVMMLKERTSLVKVLNIEAIIGTSLDKEKVSIHSCVNKSTDPTKEVRKRKTFLFTCRSADDATALAEAIDRNVLDKMPGGHPSRRKIRVIINPKSGKRQAEIVYREIEALFRESKMTVKKTVTKGPDHSKQIGYKMANGKYDTIVFVSGDGLFHEFVNGMMARDDWREASRVNISLIPAGTGNGVACSLGLADPMASALATIRGQSRPMDVSVIQQGNQKWASILSLTWGLVSDVDIESEKYRVLGPIRIMIGAAIRIINLRVYKGKISYLPAFEASKSDIMKIPKCSHSCDICKSTDSVAHTMNLLSTSGENSTPSSPTTTTVTTETTIEASSSADDSVVEEIKQQQEEEQPEESKNNSPALTSSSSTSTTTSSSPTLSASKVITRDIVVPQPKIGDAPDNSILTKNDFGEEWRTIEGEFLGVVAATVSHLSSDFIASPVAHYSDGFIELIVIKHSSKITKASLISILTDAETGKHIHSPFIDIYKVKSMILEPGTDREGIIAIDGEPALLMLLTAHTVVNGQVITTTIYVDQTSTNTSTVCGLAPNATMACSSIAAALYSYSTQFPQPINSALNIEMAAGVYLAANGSGNYNLNLLFLNVTIGPSPFSQGQVIIDFYNSTNPFFSLESIQCNTTNIVFNNMTFTNGSQAFSTIVNTVNVVLNNVNLSYMTVTSGPIVGFTYNSDSKCAPSLRALTINGGSVTNCSAVNATLIQVDGSLSISQSEFIDNTAEFIIDQNRQLVNFTNHFFGTLFLNNTFGKQLLSTGETTSITNCSFIDNTGSGPRTNPMVSFGNGFGNIIDTIFDGNTNVPVLIQSLNGNFLINGTTFTNNELSDDGIIVLVYMGNFTMDNSSFWYNTAATEVHLNNINATLTNVEFGKCRGLDTGAIECSKGSITMNDISNHLGSNIYDCHLSSRCTNHGNLGVCRLIDNTGALAGIIVGSILGFLVLVAVGYLFFKRMKQRSQYNSVQ